LEVLKNQEALSSLAKINAAIVLRVEVELEKSILII
jgi:hypothetical protein